MKKILLSLALSTVCLAASAQAEYYYRPTTKPIQVAKDFEEYQHACFNFSKNMGIYIDRIDGIALEGREVTMKFDNDQAANLILQTEHIARLKFQELSAQMKLCALMTPPKR